MFHVLITNIFHGFGLYHSMHMQVIEGTANIEEEWGIDVVSYECQVHVVPP
jgi:hypothetical protein